MRRRAIAPETKESMSGVGTAGKHPLAQLDEEEIRGAVSAVRDFLPGTRLRVNHVTLHEPEKQALIEYFGNGEDALMVPPREANVRVMSEDNSDVFDAIVSIADGGASCMMIAASQIGDGCSPRVPDLSSFHSTRCQTHKQTNKILAGASFAVKETTKLPSGTNPLLTPDDCDLAETIARGDAGLRAALKERFDFTDMDRLICDPWSVHLASESHPALDALDAEAAGGEGSGKSPRLVQCFLYMRQGSDDDNQYAHPIDILPTVDLNSGRVVHIFVPEGDKPDGGIPSQSVNYHREMLHTNDFLETSFREPPKALDITQPEGPSFSVDGNTVEWQKWKMTVGFNHREDVERPESGVGHRVQAHSVHTRAGAAAAAHLRRLRRHATGKVCEEGSLGDPVRFRGEIPRGRLHRAEPRRGGPACVDREGQADRECRCRPLAFLRCRSRAPAGGFPRDAL